MTDWLRSRRMEKKKNRRAEKPAKDFPQSPKCKNEAIFRTPEQVFILIWKIMRKSDTGFPQVFYSEKKRIIYENLENTECAVCNVCLFHGFPGNAGGKNCPASNPRVRLSR